jgi:hypothetical protein
MIFDLGAVWTVLGCGIMKRMYTRSGSDGIYKAVGIDARDELWHRKGGRHGKKRLLAFEVI